MARAARLALADMRATQKQMNREEMHGGAFHGAGMVGAGATPSMGLSQFRGGKRGCGKGCKGCEMCMDESSSDEEGEMHGGAWYSAALGALGLGAKASTSAARAAARAAERAASSTALAVRPVASIAPYSATTASRSIAARLAALNTPASRALAVRTPGTVKPYSAAEAAYRLGATAPAKSMAARLAAMGVTPARVAAALAAGVAVGALSDYFSQEAEENKGDAGYYDDVSEAIPTRPGAPGTGPSVGPMRPDGLPGMTADEEAFYLQTGNIPYRYLEGTIGRAKKGGKKMPAANDGRRARAAVVKKVMQEKGLSLPKASQYVKENGLYKK